MKQYAVELDEDGVPWASPEIQVDYEAALGRFMLAFNRLDNQLANVIATILSRLQRPDLIKACTSGQFWQKLLVIDLLKCSSEGGVLKEVPVVLMREVARHRNKLAHGHFDQNPFSGEFDIVVKDAAIKYSADMIDGFAEKANIAWDALRYVDAAFAFSDDPL